MQALEVLRVGYAVANLYEFLRLFFACYADVYPEVVGVGNLVALVGL